MLAWPALLTGVRDTFSLKFLEAVEKAVAQADAMLVLKLTEEDAAKEEAAAIELVAKGVRNLIIWPSGKALAEATFERLRVLGTNMVFFDSVLPGYYADYIGLDNKHAVELYKIAKNKFAFDTDWLPDRHTNRINPPKTAWEITPYYTRCYSKHRVFMRGPKPAELADIARITARQRRQYETRLNLSNPILTGLRFLKVFENESTRTFAQAAEILGISLPTPKTGEFYSISPNGVCGR